MTETYWKYKFDTLREDFYNFLTNFIKNIEKEQIELLNKTTEKIKATSKIIRIAKIKLCEFNIQKNLMRLNKVNGKSTS